MTGLRLAAGELSEDSEIMEPLSKMIRQTNDMLKPVRPRSELERAEDWIEFWQYRADRWYNFAKEQIDKRTELTGSFFKVLIWTNIIWGGLFMAAFFLGIWIGLRA
jgi:hypothetical protein